MNFRKFASRRTRELYLSTRAEILLSMGAILFFAAVLAWRIRWAGDRVPPWAWLAVIAWVLISLYRFRDRLWHKGTSWDDRAAPALDYYRNELARRRDHLRNEWLWHGPLLLACLIFGASVVGKMMPGRLLTLAPLFVLLVVWTGFGIWRRRRQAEELQREIDDISPD